MRFLLKKSVAQISGGHCVKWNKPGSGKKKQTHTFSLTYRIFKKVISWENGVDQCCGGKRAGGATPGVL